MVHLILAMDKNRGIGLKGQLPWKIKRDMKFFRALTSSPDRFAVERQFGIERTSHPAPVDTQTPDTVENAVVMGRKTWDSIPEKFRPLPERHNVVLSRRQNPGHPGGVSHFTEPDVCFEQLASRHPEVYVIGGSEIYSLSLASGRAKSLYITQIDSEFRCDVYFPPIPEGFRLVGQAPRETEGDHAFRFCVYEFVSQ